MLGQDRGAWEADLKCEQEGKTTSRSWGGGWGVRSEFQGRGIVCQRPMVGGDASLTTWRQLAGELGGGLGKTLKLVWVLSRAASKNSLRVLSHMYFLYSP